MKTAIFGAGCFWGVQAEFDRQTGVQSTEVGYLGGHVPNPTYQQVCADDTGHAEVIKIIYDPAAVSYAQLLEIFWAMHDPTQLNRQGPDVGTQYRSAIFYTEEAQRETAETSKQAQQASGRYASEIVTEITAAGPFYAAEEYHQKYLEKKGLSSCRVDI